MITWSVTTAVLLLLVALIVGAPLAIAQGHGSLGLAIYGAFSHICHQPPERSFFIAGHQFAVRPRCTGIYVGLATTAIIYPLLRSLRRVDTPRRTWLFIAAAPMLLDVGLGFSGLRHSTHLSRSVTGLLLGAAAVFYIMPGLMDLSLHGWRSFFRPAARVDKLPQAHQPSAPSDYGSPHLRIQDQ